MCQPDYLDIPLNLVSEEHRRIYEEWVRLNIELPESISTFVKNAEQSSFASRINLDRFRRAVGLLDQRERLGLVFENIQQQQDFIGSFQQCMSIAGYNSFLLIATGSSFQGLSTNPTTFKALGYMKFCGEKGTTDLDLQIYCSELLKNSIEQRLPAFDSHLKIRDINGQEYARLTTFDNKTDSERATPYVLVPLLKRFEVEWTKKLERNFLFKRTGTEFEGVSIALMTEAEFVQEDLIGSPYKLC